MIKQNLRLIWGKKEMIVEIGLEKGKFNGHPERSAVILSAAKDLWRSDGQRSFAALRMTTVVMHSGMTAVGTGLFVLNYPYACPFAAFEAPVSRPGGFGDLGRFWAA